MKESPLLFNGDMVRAILDGRKTQTRRIVKDIPWKDGANPNFSQATAFSNASEFVIAGDLEMTNGFRCPLGVIGDRLWVRECFAAWWSRDTGKRTHVMGYRADIDPADWDGFGVDDPWWLDAKWEPSIHMPRAFSRITLEITDVRVERLQSISEQDAEADGKAIKLGGHDDDFARNCFRELWDSIYGASSWDSNPWVWAITFKQVKP